MKLVLVGYDNKCNNRNNQKEFWVTSLVYLTHVMFKDKIEDFYYHLVSQTGFCPHSSANPIMNVVYLFECFRYFFTRVF
jgi:hypothetical protein